MNDFNFKQPYVGLNAIIEKGGKFLMVKEADGPHKGKWNFPGGRWDKKETLIEGVKREVREETGYSLKVNYILGLYSKFKKRPSFTVVALQILFVGETYGKRGGIFSDISETAYFTIEEIFKMDENQLFDVQYKTALEQYWAGIKYPISLINHAESIEDDYF